MCVITDELNNIEVKRKQAFNLICNERYGAAMKKLKSLKKSHCVSEAMRAAVPLEAYICLLKGKEKKGRELITQSMCYLWTDLDSLYILRSGNPPISPKSGYYQLKIKGGLLTLGMFTQFTNEHILTADVVAESREKALTYLDGICTFADPASRELISCSKHESLPDESDREGVYMTYPLSLSEEIC